MSLRSSHVDSLARNQASERCAAALLRSLATRSLALVVLVALVSSAAAQSTPAPTAPGQQQPAAPQLPDFDPFKTKPDNAPKVTANSEGDIRIQVPAGEVVTLGQVGCKVAVVGKRVYNVETGNEISQLDDDYQQHGSSARILSQLGTYFVAEAEYSAGGYKLLVWNTATGKLAVRIPLPSSASSLTTLTFSRDKYLILATRDSFAAEVWDCEAGKVAKELPLPYQNKWDDRKLFFSPDGRYFAAIGDEGVVVCNTATSKIVASMQSPVVAAVAAASKRPVPLSALQNNIQAKLNNRFTFGGLETLAFSPDGKELAGFTTYPEPRLLVWDEKGKITADAMLTSVPRHGLRETILWLPGNMGWLINGCMVERQSKLTLLSVRRGIGSDLALQPLDENRWIGKFGKGESAVETVRIPWELLYRTLAAMKNDSDAYIAPNTSTSLIVEFAGLRGDAGEAQTKVQEAINRRLAQFKMKLEGGQQTAFRIRLAERAGDRLPIFERQSRFDFFGINTGRTAVEAEGEVVVEFLAAGVNQPLYREVMHVTSSRSFSEEVNDATLRKSMLDNLAYRIASLDLPYYIPKSDDLIALPAVIE